MRGGKVTTQKQLQANRKNAKLGGIKTTEGKMKSKMNAVKHGILSDMILLDGDFQENPTEFEEIRSNVYEAYKPEGIIEEFCVQRIIYGIWRMRRALKAEKGIIQSFTSSFISEKEHKRTEIVNSIYIKIPTVNEALAESNPKLIQRAIELFQSVKNEFERFGNLPEDRQERLCNYFFRDRNYWTDGELAEANSRLNPDVEDSIFADSSEEEKVEAKTIIEDCLNKEIEKLKKSIIEVEKQISNQDTANLYSMLIPNQFDSERLQRYETAIENQIYKAIDELGKYQAMRNNK